MSPAEMVKTASLATIARTLGGPEPKHGRIPAFWRGGTGLNVSLDDERGVWFDHVRGEGGGVLDFIGLALDCDRRQAVRWLAQHLGATLDNPSPAERQEWKRKRQAAEASGRDLAQWTAGLTAYLKMVRNATWSSCNAIDRWADKQGELTDDPRWAEVARVPERRRFADALDGFIEKVLGADAFERAELRDRLTGGNHV